MTSSQKPVDDIICSGVTPFLLFSQYGILYAEHQNIFPFRKLLFYSAQYFPVSEAKPHKPQLHFGLHLGAVCGSCGMRHSLHASFRWAKKRANQRIITCINSLKIILIRMCFSHFPQRKEAPFITHLLFSVQSKNHAHLHQTVLLLIGYVVVQWNWNNWGKFGFIAASALFTISVIYILIIKPFNFSRLLFGMSKK